MAAPYDAEILAWHVHMQARRLSAHTISSRVGMMVRLERWLGRPAITATADDLGAFQAHLAATRSTARSLYTALEPLRTFYAWAQRQDLIEVNPAVRGLNPPRLPRLLPRPMARDDVQRALDTAPPRVRPWIALMMLAGLRSVEIARLTRQDVLDTDNPPSIRLTGKGGHERIMPISKRLLDELREGGMPRSGPLYRMLDGRPINPRRVMSLCNQHLRDLGIDGTAHQVRHSFGSAAYAVSRDIRVVQELMGHASPVTTAGYAATVPGTSLQVMEAVSA